MIKKIKIVRFILLIFMFIFLSCSLGDFKKGFIIYGEDDPFAYNIKNGEKFLIKNTLSRMIPNLYMIDYFDENVVYAFILENEKIYYLEYAFVSGEFLGKYFIVDYSPKIIISGFSRNTNCAYYVMDNYFIKKDVTSNIESILFDCNNTKIFEKTGIIDFYYNEIDSVLIVKYTSENYRNQKQNKTKYVNSKDNYISKIDLNTNKTELLDSIKGDNLLTYYCYRFQKYFYAKNNKVYSVNKNICKFLFTSNGGEGMEELSMSCIDNDLLLYRNRSLSSIFYLLSSNYEDVDLCIFSEKNNSKTVVVNIKKNTEYSNLYYLSTIPSGLANNY